MLSARFISFLLVFIFILKPLACFLVFHIEKLGKGHLGGGILYMIVIACFSAIYPYITSDSETQLLVFHTKKKKERKTKWLYTFTPNDLPNFFTTVLTKLFFRQMLICSASMYHRDMLVDVLNFVFMVNFNFGAGVTPAEKLLELYNGKWGQNIDPVFEELLYWGQSRSRGTSVGSYCVCAQHSLSGLVLVFENISLRNKFCM